MSFVAYPRGSEKELHKNLRDLQGFDTLVRLTTRIATPPSAAKLTV